MRFAPLIFRVTALAVAAHLAMLPVAASLHAASHFRYEAGVALDEGVERCKDADPRTHRGHVDRDRAEAGDLLCAFCQLFHKVLQNPGATGEIQLSLPSTIALAIPSPDELPFVSRSIPLPQSRSPPLFA